MPSLWSASAALLALTALASTKVTFPTSHRTNATSRIFISSSFKPQNSTHNKTTTTTTTTNVSIPFRLLPRADAEWVADTDPMDLCAEPGQPSSSRPTHPLFPDTPIMDCIDAWMWLRDNHGYWEITEWGDGDDDLRIYAFESCTIAITAADASKLPISIGGENIQKLIIDAIETFGWPNGTMPEVYGDMNCQGESGQEDAKISWLIRRTTD